ncbi:MAG: hypothetical protein II936_04600 [Oscillospiraceae bacterium]|nr:hypothetical protein [Oscillospiraceae bacterium]
MTEAEIGYSEENMWYSQKAEHSGFTNKLKEIVNNEDTRGAVLVATDDDIISYWVLWAKWYIL